MKRHSIREITAALDQARKMEQAGYRQADICKELDISVMTLHRWRLQGHQDEDTAAAKAYIEENHRLRQLAVDLLLEKALLVDQLPAKSRAA